MARKETDASSAIPKRFPMTEAIWKSLGESKMQSLFFFIFLVGLPFLAFFLHEFDSIFQMRVSANPSYDWPKYSDLTLALISTVIIIVIFQVIQKFFTGVCESFISPKYKGIERRDRAEKMIKSLFKGTYFTFASVFAYLISKDSFFMPASLGGSGDVEKTFEGYPYFDKSGLRYMKEYFMVQLGYHFSSFLLLFVGKMRNDFMEMLLHHSITVFLLSLAYLMNYWPISLMILFTHDVSDAFVCFTRVFADTSYSKVVLVCYIMLMVSWVYTRLIIFPFDLIRISCYQNPKIEEIYGIGILGSMAHALIFLHIYWFILLCQMGYKFIFHKVQNDTQNDLSR
jgi:ceramide synthetase